MSDQLVQMLKFAWWLAIIITIIISIVICTYKCCITIWFCWFKVRTSFPPIPPADDTQLIVVTATVSSELQKKVNMIVPVSAPIQVAHVNVIMYVRTSGRWLLTVYTKCCLTLNKCFWKSDRMRKEVYMYTWLVLQKPSTYTHPIFQL